MEGSQSQETCECGMPHLGGTEHADECPVGVLENNPWPAALVNTRHEPTSGEPHEGCFDRACECVTEEAERLRAENNQLREALENIRDATRTSAVLSRAAEYAERRAIDALALGGSQAKGSK